MPKRTQTFKRILIFCLLLIIIAFIPTPYYLYQPGPIEELESRVTIEGGHKDEKGSFHLTTILSLKAANIYILGYGLIAPHTEIKQEKDVKGNLSDEEYSKLLDFMMKDSKQNALVAAFTTAGEKVEMDYHGIFVNQLLANSPAKDILQVGDVITSIDGKQIGEVTEFTTYLEQNKQPGDTVDLVIMRDDKELKETVELMAVDKQTNRAGIGFQPEEDFTATLPRDAKIESEDIGGPSAGLMFSLEILNQLTEEDLTKGYKIAGTGTIDHHGNVGQIGGITHKVTSAYKEGADIFFTPKDLTALDSNEKDVRKEAKANNYEIEIVPVATLDEAVTYLKKLENKQ
ncbi:SepM family pheromone-processing serine protease [Metabacillus malikii]|uniref:endopeptidase La n=1 Tax=Metabacillus malikii TaxID=1504265 RepID=A0ABT9ZEV6_9BACI|nr:SepM family pheromone-processing serine protease [Metabacillus malikii]MDQ0230788.1 PDZ domain-containing protein [Metabacillus malikii]